MSGLEGTTLGRYQLLGRLGHGGMSEVYLAYDDLMKRNVAIKVVSSVHADYLERFQREAEAIGRLQHDHILPAFDYGNQEPWHYLVMPYIEGGTLRDILDQGPLSLEEIDEILPQIASALQYAHDNGIIHRDIKPSNILMRDLHYAYLADFGLAKAMEGGSELTQTGALLGTPEYMAPDLADGPATTSSDIYALGVLLYQMLAGRVPFTGETAVSVYMKHVREQPLPPSLFNSSIPRSIDQVALHALEKDPRRRFQTVQELTDAYARARTAPILNDTQEMSHQEMTQEPIRPVYSDTPGTALYRRGGRQARQARQARLQNRPSSQGRRLILPGNPAVAPSSVFSRRRRTTAPISNRTSGDAAASTAQSTSEPLPPLPLRSTPAAAKEVNTTPLAPRHTTTHSRSRGGLAAIIVVIGLLLFVVFPIGFIYRVYSTTPHPTPTPLITATPNTAATQLAQATATAQAEQQGTSIPVTNGSLLLQDSLASNTNGRWSEDNHCIFTGSTYHIKVQQADFLQPCALLAPSLSDISNVSIQVDVSLLTGTNAGMLLRLNGRQFYDFEINNQGQFFFRRHDSGAGSNYVYLFNPTPSSVIALEGQKNTLRVVAKDDTFQLYINDTFVGETRDATYASGQIALATGTLSPQTYADGSFANVKVYKIA